MYISSKRNCLGYLLAVVMVLSSVACSSSGDKKVSEQVDEDYEYVYVDENGNQVDPKSVNSDDYEIVNADEVADLKDSISDAEDMATSETTVSDEEATDEELKEMLANINDGEDSLDSAPAPTEPSLAEAPVQDDMSTESSTLAEESESMDSGEYVSLNDDVSPEATQQVAEEGVYVVQRGDTLSEISQRLTGTFRNWPQLAEKNSLENPHMIFPGDRISYAGMPLAANGPTTAPTEAPVSGPYVEVEAGDTLGTLATKLYGNPGQWKNLYELNKDRIENPDLIFVGQRVVYSQALADQRPETTGDEMTAPAEQMEPAVDETSHTGH